MRVLRSWSAGVVCAATVVAGVLVVNDAGAAGSSVTLHATSRNAPVSNETYVTYGRAGFMRAALHGTVVGVGSGAVVRLRSVPFPFTHAVLGGPMPLSVHGTSASFTVAVRPAFETRYRAVVYASRSATTPEAVSRSVTVFVIPYVRTFGVRLSCRSDRVCSLRASAIEVFPGRIAPAELQEHVFKYLRVQRLLGATMPRAFVGVARLTRTGSTLQVRIAGQRDRVTLTIRFREPTYRYRTIWAWCTKDDVARDGMGLAGSHACGNRLVRLPSRYLG